MNSGFYYNNADQREKMVQAERKWVDDKTQLVLDLKRKACKEGETLVLINQKGIDPLALDMLAKEGILALRRCAAGRGWRRRWQPPPICLPPRRRWSARCAPPRARSVARDTYSCT